MAGFASALFFIISRVEVVEEDGDTSLNEVGDQLYNDGRQDQLQGLLQPVKRCLFWGFHFERSLAPCVLSIELKMNNLTHPADSSLCRGHISTEDDSLCTQF